MTRIPDQFNIGAEREKKGNGEGHPKIILQNTGAKNGRGERKREDSQRQRLLLL